MNSSPAVFFVLTADRQQLISVSPEYEAIWGKTCASLYQDPTSWLDSVHPEDRPRVEASLQPASTASLSLTYRIVQPNGTLRWIAAHRTLVPEQPNAPAQIIEYAEDITPRASAEQDLHRANRALRTLSECSQALVRATDEAALLREICQILVEFGGYRAAWIGFAENDESQSVRAIALAGYADEYLQSVNVSWGDNALGWGPTGIAIRTGQPAAAQDILQDPNYEPWREAALRHGYAAAIALPLKLDGTPWGALNLYSIQPDAFDSDEIKFLSELASDLAYGITTLRNRNALYGSEMKFRAFLEMASEAVIISNTHGDIVLFNATAEDLFGYSQAEILGQPVEVLMPERFRHGHVHFRQGYHSSPGRRSMGQSRNLYARRRDGSEFPIEAGLSAVEIEGDRFILTFLTDISQRQQIEAERQQAEAELRESEARFRNLADNASVMVWVTEAGGDCTYLSQSWCDFTGQPQEAGLGYGWLESLHPDDREQADALFHQANANQAAFRLEYRLRRQDGEYRWVIDAANPWFGEDGQFKGYIGSVLDISDRKQAEEALRQNEATLRQAQADLHQTNQELEARVALRTAELSCLNERLQQELAEQMRLAAIVESSDDGIIGLNLDGMISSWNRGAEKIYGYGAAEIVGRSVHHLLPPDLYHEENAIIERIKRGEQLEHYETRRQRKNGTLFDVSLTISPIRDATGEVIGISKIARDISDRKRHEAERKRTEEALARELDRSKALFEASFDGIVVLNQQGYVVEANESFARMLGRTLEETLTLHVADWDAQWTRAELEQIIITCQFVGRTFETLHRRKDGTTYEVEITISDVTLEEEVVQVCICRDITDRKQAEDQLRLSNERMSLANAELARAARLKDEFLASMSHELRTPLNAILGLSEALIEEIFGAVTAEQREHLSTIERSGQHLLALINDILDLSKVESGKMELEITSVPVQEFCDSCLSFIKQQAHHKRIKLDCRIDPDLVEIDIDERRIRQVLVNLLSNAVKFTPDHGKVQLQLWADPLRDTLEFSVTDTGIGIAPEHLDKLFQPFVQIDSALSRRYSGTGLGLALVRRIAELHGGSVTLESQEGKGSRFIISLPWQPTTEAEPTVEPELDELRSPDRPVQQVLIIEDSAAAANQLVRYLKELGIQALVHPQGAGAVQLALQSQPDVIILDILLPDQSGWTVLADLKAHDVTQAIPVIVVSVVDEQLRSLDMGAIAHLLKPFTRQQLQQTLGRAIALDTSSEPPTALVVGPIHTPVILLAEDNEANIATFDSYLSAQGLQVIVSRNGREAVEMASQYRPDVVLMDIQMPQMDGLEAIRRIRQVPELQDLPIIALTALAMPGDRDRCLAAGASDYLTKPISPKQLLQTLARHTATISTGEA